MTVPHVGAICLFSGVFEINGWLYCAGQVLPAADFPELYEVIGNKYGGDADTNFALPDLQQQEKELKGARYQIAIANLDNRPQYIIGSIFLCVADTPPERCVFCDGSLLRVNEYTPLYTILMARFGGNGTSTFGLPNLTDAEKNLNGARYAICTDGLYPTRG
jgi:microcystin-dependent protein